MRPATATRPAVAQAKLDRMAALDAEARRYESANARIADVDQAALERCRAELVAATRADAERVAKLANAPHSYNDALRVVGLYPLSKFPFTWGVAAWQQTTRDLFATPFPELTVIGKRIRYVPGSGGSEKLAGLLPTDRAGAGPLRMPVVTPARAWQLLQQHAPVLVVDTVDDDDRIGRLAWRKSGDDLYVAVDVSEPATYVRAAWTEFDGVAHAAACLHVLVPGPARQPSARLGGGPARRSRLAGHARCPRPPAGV